MCACVRIPLLSNFAFKKPTICSKQFLWQSNEEQDEADFTIREGVIETIPRQLRYTTQGSMAERSEAPDSKNIPLSLWYSNVCVGSNTTPVEFCVQKANTFCSKQFLWELNEEQDEADLHYKTLFSKTDWSNCNIQLFKAGWPSGLRH